eukprot:9648405-Alexandrium_andersonii.AAC.1
MPRSHREAIPPKSPDGRGLLRPQACASQARTAQTQQETRALVRARPDKVWWEREHRLCTHASLTT